MKRIIRLTESDIHRIVDRSVKRILRESNINDEYSDVGKYTIKKVDEDYKIYVYEDGEYLGTLDADQLEYHGLIGPDGEITDDESLEYWIDQTIKHKH